MFAVIAVCVALGGSMMVSYVRARAEGLGLQCKVGIMQRPERIVLLGIGALIHEIALMIAVTLVAVLSNFTAIQRLLHVRNEERRLKENPS
jgi:CDP-diacylglycerol--glycerol-3-phosphate 3-phosphatidyltransferase